jgi:hypothetical protein
MNDDRPLSAFAGIWTELQRPLPDADLMIVVRGTHKQDRGRRDAQHIGQGRTRRRLDPGRD